ncbi:hypothetical protein HWV62_21282 [Athelia sp. TMB]|nr:hypothetical protein HWV62_21282 [Athelia sp. TMB]
MPMMHDDQGVKVRYQDDAWQEKDRMNMARLFEALAMYAESQGDFFGIKIGLASYVDVTSTSLMSTKIPEPREPRALAVNGNVITGCVRIKG